MLFKIPLTSFNVKVLKAAIFCFIILKVVAFDIFTKRAAITMFSHSAEPFALTDFLNFILIYNPGISFGMLKNFAYSNYIFLILNILISLCLLFWLYKNATYIYCLAVGFIIGGAIGNLIDRFSYGAVIDFIDFHIYSWHYPTFNFADGAIVIGVAIIITESVLENFHKPYINK